ncbi:MAG: EamA family transporter, partial [Polyangiaceae bacterium]
MFSPRSPVSASAPSAAYAWMSLGAILFAGMNFFVHLSSAHVSWTLVGAVRASMGALVAITVARVRSVSFIPKNTRAMWMRSIFGTCSMGCVFYALGSPSLALGDAATLVNLTPVFLALLAPLVLHERAGRRVLLALPLSVGGVLLMLRPSLLFGGGAAN